MGACCSKGQAEEADAVTVPPPGERTPLLSPTAEAAPKVDAKAALATPFDDDDGQAEPAPAPPRGRTGPRQTVVTVVKEKHDEDEDDEDVAFMKSRVAAARAAAVASLASTSGSAVPPPTSPRSATAVPATPATPATPAAPAAALRAENAAEEADSVGPPPPAAAAAASGGKRSLKKAKGAAAAAPAAPAAPAEEAEAADAVPALCLTLRYDERTQMLHVGVGAARHLPATQVLRGGVDAYVKVYVLPDPTKATKQKTRIIRGTVAPIFDELFTIHVPAVSLETRTLEASLCHESTLTTHRMIGRVRLPLTNITDDKALPTWYPLELNHTVRT